MDFGVPGAPSPSTDAERFDPSSGTWTTLPAFVTLHDEQGVVLASGLPLREHTATPLPDGRLLLAGGPSTPSSWPPSTRRPDARIV
jgi:hypothetical protein